MTCNVINKATSHSAREAMALKRWQDLNPDVLHYQVIFAGDQLATNALDETRKFVSHE